MIIVSIVFQSLLLHWFGPIQHLHSHSISLGFDLRPFLYPSRFPYQFAMIDHAVAELPDRTGPTMDPKAKVD